MSVKAETSPNQKLWEASTEQKQNSNLAKFIKQLNEKYTLDLNVFDYPALHKWSVQNRALFWESLWNYCQIIHSQDASSVLENPNEITKSIWFKNSKLNFAENLLFLGLNEKHASQKQALIEYNEIGKVQSLSYQQLIDAVKNLAAFLKAQGLQSGDRVAACMPNCAETVIAMLATSSIGAIWSSCSPDFGAKGMLDRFEQIQPKILFTCLNYQYKGKIIDIQDNISELSRGLTSLQTIIYLDNKFNKSSQGINISLQDNIKLFSFNEAKQYQTEDFHFEQNPFNHPLYIMFSSGTTGVPKCIVHGAGGTLLQHLKEQQLHCNLTPDDTIFYFSTCGWMMWNWLISALATKATVVLYDGSPFHPKTDYLFDIAQNENISIMGLGAPYIAALEKEVIAPKQSHKLENLKCILSTGSPLSAESFSYVYQNISDKLCLSSISGGTDIISCFVLGNPNLPVYQGEIQCAGLAMDVDVYSDEGLPLREQKGELVCKQSFPSMPIGFWNDESGQKFYKAYFARFENHWAHGDYAEITSNHGFIIHGRSDAVLNPGGVRIGTAEIYRQVQQVDEVLESVVVGQNWKDDVRVILFVRLKPDLFLNETISETIKKVIRNNTTPRHVPKIILQVNDIPKTKSGKIVELAVKEIINGGEVKNIEALANPEALNFFKNRSELLI